MLYDEDEDEDIIDVNQNEEDDDSSQGDGEGNQQQQQQQQPIDAAEVARIVASTMASHREPPPPRQMSTQELAEHFQVWNPDESYVNGLNKLVDPDVPLAERQQILNDMRDGMVNQAFRASELLYEQQVQKLDARYAPALQLAQEREAKKLQTNFEAKYPSLKGQTDLVNSITAGLTAQGFKPKSHDEAFDKVAEVAASILQKVNPEFKLTKGGGSTGRPTMTGTNMSGQSGGFQATGGSQGSSGKRGGLAAFYKK